MLLILVRHGNTFNAGEKTYRVGKRNDLPLVSAGLEQAAVFAAALREKNINPSAIYCGPLQRTKIFAQIITQRLNLGYQPVIDDRLNELDYGLWAGLSDEEVRTKLGNELEAWEKNGKWPKNSAWPESEKDVVQDVKLFTRDVLLQHKSDDIVVVVSSNGKLRYFLKLVENEFESRIKSGHVKVGTGNTCVIACEGDRFELVVWNINPSEL